MRLFFFICTISLALINQTQACVTFEDHKAQMYKAWLTKNKHIKQEILEEILTETKIFNEELNRGIVYAACLEHQALSFDHLNLIFSDVRSFKELWLKSGVYTAYINLNDADSSVIEQYDMNNLICMNKLRSKQ